MKPERICPDCGAAVPADAPRGLCPQCLLKAALLGPWADASAAIGEFETSDAGVLDTIAQSIGTVPRVLLRDTGPGEAPGPIVRLSGDAGGSIRYRIDGEIARGGMGAVLKGRDPDLGREVAVKVLRDDLRDDAAMVRRFVEEAQIGGQLQHPGIVPIYELGTMSDRRPFFSMKLVKGHTLAQLLDARPGPEADLPRFLSIFEAVCQTMAYAHTRGVIHRDLKPSNVMVGGFGEVQVMDWGLAKVLPRGGVVDDASAGEVCDETVIATARSGDSDADHSRAGSVMGTPSYMAPEQARGQIDQVDERADVFALGSILCEILTDSPAFTGRSSGEIQRKAALGDTTEALARLDASGADAELIDLAKDCLSRERDDRPRDASAVAERMTAYLAGVQERMRRAELNSVEERARRRLTTVVAASVLTLTVLVGGGWLWVKGERDARRLALNRDVNDALNQATALRARAGSAASGAAALFAQAREQAQRATALVERGPADDALKAQATRLQAELDDEEKDHRLVAALEAARLAQAETSLELQFVLGRAVPLFREAFRAYGMAAGEGAPDAAAARIGRRPPAVREAVIAALDEWVDLASDPKRGIDEPHVEWLRAVASAAEPANDWTRAFRAALAEPDATKRLQSLKKLAAEVDVRKQTPRTLTRIARGIKDLDPVEEGPSRVVRHAALELLRRAQRQYPADFWINNDLGMGLSGANSTPRENDEAVRFLTVAVALRPDSAGTRINLGCVLENAGQVDESLSSYEKAIELQPKLAPAHFNRGVALDKKGRIDEAVACFKKAVELDPKYARAHLSLGLVLDKKGRIDEAVACYKQAVELDPKFAAAHNSLGIALGGKGQIDQAVACFKKAVELDPKNATAHNSLGAALDEKGQIDEAVACFNKAVELDPKHATVHFNLGLVQSKKGRIDEAVACFKKVVELDPKFVPAHLSLGIAQLRKGRIDEAVACYMQAVELDPKNATAHNSLGAALDEKGQIDEAVACFKKAVELAPKFAAAHFNLGLVQSRKGRIDEAVASFKKAVELGYETARPKLALAERAAAREKLADFLYGRYKPTTNEERLGLTEVGQAKKRSHEAARLYADAFAADPKLADELKSCHRYNAACFASLAAAGRGDDAADLDDAEKARLRKQALDWLRADLALWAKMLDGGSPADRVAVQRIMTHWRRDSDLAGLREPDALAKLPESEREEWRTLWRDVEALATNSVRPGPSD